MLKVMYGRPICTTNREVLMGYNPVNHDNKRPKERQYLEEFSTDSISIDDKTSLSQSFKTRSSPVAVSNRALVEDVFPGTTPTQQYVEKCAETHSSEELYC